MVRTGIVISFLLLALSWRLSAQVERTAYRPMRSEWRGLKQGDFVGGIPCMKFGTLPFSGRVSGSQLVLRFNYNDSTLISSPRLSGVGSSTLAGGQPTGSSSYPSILQARFTNNGYSLSFFNFSQGGHTTEPILPLSMGGTANYSIDDAIGQNPTIILLDEPTNWAQFYDTATQAGYWRTLFRYAWERGIILVANSSRPRNNFSGDALMAGRLWDFRRAIQLDDTLRQIVNNDYGHFLEYNTRARIDPSFAYSDSTHMTEPGVRRLEADQYAFWRNKVFTPVTAFKSYLVYSSTDSASWSYMDSVTNGNRVVKSYTAPAVVTWYKVFGRYKDNSVTPTSVIKITPAAIDSVVAQFNFNATAQGVTDWTDVSGDPHLSVISATDSRRGVGVNSVATNRWNPSTNNSTNTGGQTTGNPTFIFGTTVTASYWFNNGQKLSSSPYDFTYAANGSNLQVTGLTPGGKYRLGFLGSRIGSQVSTSDRKAGYWVTGAGTTEYRELDVKANTINVATFSDMVADASGNFNIGIYCPTGASSTNTYQFGYLNGLRITLQSN